MDSHLRFAEATSRLNLHRKGGKDLHRLMEVMTESGAQGKIEGALNAAKDELDGSVLRGWAGGAARASPPWTRDEERE